MKTCCLHFPSRAGRRAPGGFTLTELMVSMAVVVTVVSGVVAAQLYGLRMFEIVKPKLSASDEARSAMGHLAQEVRSAFIIRIGQGDEESFTEVAPNTRQIGSAIQIYPSTNMSSWIRYYWDASDRKVRRTLNGSQGVAVIANSVSNSLVFASEDFSGTVLTNNQNNRVISMTLQFYQIQYPAIAIGPGSMFDFYQLKTKVTRRTLF
jgi:prepilin-type N-terminal cleavage/methylation domain-containing protein